MAPVLCLLLAAAQESLEELRARAQRTLEQARTAREAGDRAGYDRFMGEGSYLVGLAAEAEGRFDEARRHFEAARRFGYAPAPPPAPPPEPPLDLPPPQDTLAAPPPWLAGDGLWDLYGLGPYPSPRHNGLHALVAVPPFESAMVLPEYSFAFDTRYHFDDFEFSDSSEGGATNVDAQRSILSSQFDYGLSSWLQAGLRTSAGELRAGSRARTTLFNDGAQLVRRGERDLAFESVTFRLKGHYDVSDLVETGLLAEVKLPLDGRFDLLTADSIDVGISALASRRWGPVVLHANVGGVFPFGDAEDIFRSNDDLQPVLSWGAGAVWDLGRGSLGLQVEGQTSPFAQVDLLADPVHQAILFGAYELNAHVYVSAAGGIGLGEPASDLCGSVGITFAY